MRECILLGILVTVYLLFALGKRGAGAGRRIVGGVVAFIVVMTLARSWVQVPPGTVGAVYDPFAGGILSHDLREGWHLIAPWANMQLWSVRTQEYTMSAGHDEGAVQGDDSMVCQTKEGLQVRVDATVMFHIDPGGAHRLWKTIGPGYIDTIVRPASREAIRSTVSQYPIMQVYSNAPTETTSATGVVSYQGKRKEVEDNIMAALAPTFESKGIRLERVLLRDVGYVSDQYENAIVNKQVAQQQVLTQQYLLEIERIKAQQKVVQSEGQAEAIRLRGLALRANRGVINYEFVRQLPDDMDIQVLPGNGGVILNLPPQSASTDSGQQSDQPRRRSVAYNPGLGE